MNKPDCAWMLSDLDSIPKNGVKVMSTFACGGGSSMGYKRAGCTIVAANDIDPEMAFHYKRNLNPPLYYLCPIGELINQNLAPGLFELDILDGSPPCSTFSMAGSREDSWGKDKHFREGQAKQVLSDLFFDYLDLVEKLRPKVAIAENVKGMILGNAKGYTKLVMQRFKDIGYRPQLFLVNAADCGVPQRRERVFFCALRDDIKAPELILKPKHRWISAGIACGLPIGVLIFSRCNCFNSLRASRNSFLLSPYVSGHIRSNIQAAAFQSSFEAILIRATYKA